jgi:hypothetical protein
VKIPELPVSFGKCNPKKPQRGNRKRNQLPEELSFHRADEDAYKNACFNKSQF